tara:strand:+ start:754 stop:1011 length:258 start_codon:yes stop_codon:yes gene_type:complete
VNLSRQGAIQLQLTVEIDGCGVSKTRELGRTRRPVMTNHQVGHLGMHLKLSQPTPTRLAGISGTVLTGSAAEPACQGKPPEECSG